MTAERFTIFFGFISDKNMTEEIEFSENAALLQFYFACFGHLSFKILRQIDLNELYGNDLDRCCRLIGRNF
jgi:hypothetical protein